MKHKILFGKPIRLASLGIHRPRPVQCSNRSCCKKIRGYGPSQTAQHQISCGVLWMRQ